MAKKLPKKNQAIPTDRWSKDHWSLLGYIATCFDGELDHRRLRCNENTHPLLNRGPKELGWQDSYGTRLKEPTQTLPEHDDWDCLDDLEAAGMVEIISLVNGFVVMTHKGNEIAFRLREHKQKGGNFAGFQL
jgi:hypothetical protein